MAGKRPERFALRLIGFILCAILTAAAVAAAVWIGAARRAELQRLELQQQHLEELRAQQTDIPSPTPAPTETPGTDETPAESLQPARIEYEILPEYRRMLEENGDLIGWLRIEDTVVDYPVMQTPEDEEYYLTRGFDREPNANGCLILDTDSEAGVGTAACDYADGEPPSTNLIIHGHTMRSGAMFGDLAAYADPDYMAEHSVICFDSLYEHRQYEVIAVFRSQVYETDDDVFKYYDFFQADTPEQFSDWYDSIRALSLYDTGVTAQFGDEFITLSCCAYHTEDGRFVVVGKRIV